MTSFRKRTLCAATSVLAFSAPAFAQDTAQAEDTGGLSEIVVTAQRTSQSVLEVPLSITALSGDQLSNAGIRQMSDLQLTTPGFVPSNSSGYNQMFIRGIGNAIFVGADPSVATFIDDVPRVFGTLVNNFVDVERVEVIKGAPGALYGRNATGGAVNIITRQPSTEGVEGRARISFGTKDTFQGSAFLNVPLGDKIAMTVAGERRTHGNFIRNLTPDANAYTPAMFPVNNIIGPGSASFLGTPAQTAAFFNSGLVAKDGHVSEDFWAVSGKLLFRPSDNFKITFAGDYSKKDDDTGNSGYNTTPAYPVAVLAGFLGFPPTGFAGTSTTPALLSSFVVPVTEKFTTAQRGAGFAKLKDWGVSATAVLELPGVDVTSITSYRKNKSEFLTELGSNAFAMLEAHVPLEKKTFYQELRAVSSSDGPLHWIAGASYLRAQFDGGLFTTIVRPLANEIPSGNGGYVVKNWSAYAQATYDLTDQLSVMGSVRYIDETNNARSEIPFTGIFESVKLHEKKFLPAATITYRLDGGGNVYARWARGFKAGGIVPVVPLSAFDSPTTPTVKETAGAIFAGEEVDTYEVGLRAPLMNNKVQVTAALFYNDYRNVQVAGHARPTFPTISIAVINAGSARTYGAEASVTARVADPLTLGASVGYLNAKYKDFRLSGNPVLEDFDLSNTRMINSPEWQFSAHADLDQPITEGLRLVGNAVAAYTDEVLWQASAIPGLLPDAVGKSYWLVNARLGIKSADDNWELAVYAKNLFNEGYSTFGNSAASYGNILLWGDPRVIGVEGIFKF
jgi:iron complex outermembrane recepter protein